MFTMGQLMQLVARGYEEVHFSRGPQLYINCTKSKATSEDSTGTVINNSNFRIPNIGDSIEDIVLEFKEDSRDTLWYPYSDLKQIRISINSDNTEIFKISGPTLMLLDALWFGESLVKNNIKWGRLVIPSNRTDTINIARYSSVRYQAAVGETCIYHDPIKNKQVENLLCIPTCRDLAKEIIKFTQNTECDVCSMLSSNILFNPKPNSVANTLINYTMLELPVRRNIQRTDHDHTITEFCQELSMAIEPGKTDYRLQLNFNLPIYQLVWAIVDKKKGLMTVDDDFITNSSLSLNGQTRFDNNPYYSLVYDKRLNGLKINDTLAVHSYTFGDLYENIEDSINSTLNFSRIDNATIRVTTKSIPENTEAFLHVFAINVNKLQYRSDTVTKLFNLHENPNNLNDITRTIDTR
jgi:hypothetical protein